MHLDPRTFAVHLPEAWDRLNVHERIGLVLEQHHVDYSREAVEALLALEVGELLRGMGFDVRMIEWWAQDDSGNDPRVLMLHALQYEGLDWDCEGVAGETAMHERWARTYFPDTPQEAVKTTRIIDATDQMQGISEWLRTLIAPTLRELVTRLEGERIVQDTHGAKGAKAAQRL